MLAQERQDAIVAQVNEQGSVLVKEMSEKFGVTEDSIRKDLTLLEKKGLLKKTYGGAVKIRVNVHEFYASDRKGKNLKEKQEIAKKALRFIQTGDMVFLDISTTNLELAKMVIATDLEVTIVTNMIDILLLFTVPCKSKLIFIGGFISAGRNGFIGALTNREIEQYRFDKAFLGVVGVDLDGNSVETYGVEDGITKSIILKMAEQSFMMLESRKLQTCGNYKYAKISDFTGAILEKELEGRQRELMEKYAIEWIS